PQCDILFDREPRLAQRREVTRWSGAMHPHDLDVGAAALDVCDQAPRVAFGESAVDRAPRAVADPLQFETTGAARAFRLTEGHPHLLRGVAPVVAGGERLLLERGPTFV